RAGHATGVQATCLGTGLDRPVADKTGRLTAVTCVIAEPCVDVLDRSCVEVCPVVCIYEGSRMLYMPPAACGDCGACEPVCPVEAIFYEDDVPDEWERDTVANVEFFDELGSPGGAAKTGVVEHDPQWIKDLPPMDED